MNYDGVISIHPDVCGGTPCFPGTRVFISILFDYLRAGDSLEDFLEGFPSVSRAQALAVLALASDYFLAALPVPPEPVYAYSA